jgi:curved DNA-binding protein
MSNAALSLEDARAALGLDPVDGPERLVGAFRAAVKLSHPDRPGGDAGRFREVLEAYRLLQTSLETPPSPDPAGARVEIDPLVALRGGEATATLRSGETVTVEVPAGVRRGETLRVGGEPVRAHIANNAALQVRGSDLWVTAAVPAFVLDEGGRVVAETPLGAKTLWVSRRIAERRLVRLEGQGLPARGAYPQGHLFVQLAPAAVAPESAARARLRKFAAAWAA